MKLSFGCEISSHIHETVGNVYLVGERIEAMFGETMDAFEDDSRHYKIIGHPVQWSHVLVAIGEFSQLQGNGDLQIFSEGEGLATIGTVDLTLSPEAAMLADPQLTKFLAEVLGVTK